MSQGPVLAHAPSQRWGSLPVFCGCKHCRMRDTVGEPCVHSLRGLAVDFRGVTQTTAGGTDSLEASHRPVTQYS